MQINIFERKMHTRILYPVYDNEKENWRILTTNRNLCIEKNEMGEPCGAYGGGERGAQGFGGEA